ncbi:MAG: DnaD domain protein [Bacilli bacterium]|nr:DnaD domain protein [Bacilli bacterium]
MSIKNYSIENTAFTIYVDNTLTDLDRKVLTHCYLPIIGDKAMSIYLTLFTMLDPGSQESSVLNHSQLVKLTGIPKTKLVLERRKLEAVGLLSTYYKDGHFIYVLKKVLSPYEFFNNHDFVRVLSSIIGLDDLNTLAYNFLLRRLDPNKFENITVSFDDVFDSIFETDATYLGVGVDTINNGIVINNDKFNLDHFIILVDAMDILDKAILQDDDFLNLIKRYAYLYGLSVEMLKDAVLLSVNIDKTINYEELENQVKRLYDNRNQKVVFVKKRDVVKSSDKLVNALNTLSPNELVKHKYQTELTSSEISMFDKLLKETNVSIGVLNVCILYVLSEKNGEIPSYNYFLKVLNTWIRAGIVNTMDALNHINNKTEPKKGKSTKTKTVKQVPNWYGKQESNENNDNNEEELDSDITNFFKPNE